MKFTHGKDIGRVFLFLLAGFAALAVVAQTSVEIDRAEAQKHLLKHVDPLYPAIAKAAQIQGEVVLQIEISEDGHVTNVKTLSGPPMLIGAAISAAKQWQYRPFERIGTPISVSVKVTVPFVLDTPVDPNDEKIAELYFPLSDKCNQLVIQRSDPAEQASACEKAAEQADRFAKNSRFIERRSAYVYYATALMRDKRPKEAVAVGEKAIAVVLQGHDDGSGASAAYGVTGQAKALSGDLVGADSYLEIAEDYERKALDTPAGHELSKDYSHALKTLLDFHAQVLTVLGEETKAQTKLD